MLLKRLLLAAWCGFLAVFSCLQCVSASEPTGKNASAKDAPVKLEAVKAKANPFADWGISAWGTGKPLFSLLGKAPKEMFVYAVQVNSPADLAGVDALDQITAIDGRLVTDFPWNEIVQRHRDSEKGDVVKLTLSRWGSGISREVELKLGSNRSWARADGATNFWGLIVFAETPTGVSVAPNPKLPRVSGTIDIPVMQTRRIKGARNTKEPALTQDGEPITKPTPRYVTRRVVTMVWGGKKLTLVERENGMVEVIEGGSAPKKDDVVGRLMPSGSTLTLHADGSYELKASPPKPSSSEAPPAATPTPATTLKQL